MAAHIGCPGHAGPELTFLHRPDGAYGDGLTGSGFVAAALLTPPGQRRHSLEPAAESVMPDQRDFSTYGRLLGSVPTVGGRSFRPMVGVTGSGERDPGLVEVSGFAGALTPPVRAASSPPAIARRVSDLCPQIRRGSDRRARDRACGDSSQRWQR
jgi:hypothetical protein